MTEQVQTPEIDESLPLTVKTALRLNPGSVLTERGVELERSNGYKELLVSAPGLLKVAPAAAPVVEESPVATETPAPAPVEAAPVQEPVAVVEKPRAKPGPKPKAQAETTKAE